jgi:flagellar hook-basal body complex protein FliE
MVIPPLPGIAGIGAALPMPAAGAASPTSGTDFAQALQHGLDKLQDMHHTSDKLAVQAATGELTDVHDYMIAATEASVATELTVAVRNKAVEAFNDIMRMQV